MRPDGGSFVVLFLFLLSFFKTVFLAVFVEFVSFLLLIQRLGKKRRKECVGPCGPPSDWLEGQQSNTSKK